MQLLTIVIMLFITWLYYQDLCQRFLLPLRWYSCSRGACFPGGASGKEPTCQCRRQKRRQIPWGGNGKPLQSSCLENPMDRGAWRAMTEWLSTHPHIKAVAGHFHQAFLGVSPQVPTLWLLIYVSCRKWNLHMGLEVLQKKARSPNPDIVTAFFLPISCFQWTLIIF